jgi:hypothetical protein
MKLKTYFLLILWVISIFSIAVLVKGYGSPPPPPPCSQKLAGCYSIDNFKENPGTLTPENFGYYLGEPACIKGGCSCSAAGFVSDLKQAEPDDSKGACNCISATSWTDNVGCCGNSADDCGQIVEETRFGNVIERYLCSMDENYIGSWFSSESNPGKIVYTACDNQELVSDGINWKSCDSFRVETINNHQYLCTADSSDESWIECCGSDSCRSDRSREGDTFLPGNSITTNEETYYCTSDSTFTLDLDTKDEASCQGQGLAWTGSLCCSEDDDPEEYYNDPSGNGGCWNKQVIFNGETIQDRDDITNLDGNFYGCNIPQEDNILTIEDTHTNQQLIQNKDYCFQDESKSSFCSFSNKWELTSFGKRDRSNPSAVPSSFNVQQPTECCAQDQCWSGQECIENQKNNPNALPTNGYRCIDGQWSESNYKFNPEGTTEGFCPEPIQCLVDPLGNSQQNDQPDKDPVCITNQQFIKDNYCEEGIWTSRTKFVALELIDIAQPNDFTLYCDTPSNTLNNLDYIIQGQLAETIVSEDNTNNFCLLQSNNKIIIGTSLNKPVTQVTPLLRLLDIDNCNVALIDDNQYHSCDGTQSSKAWYNQKTESLIYSDEEFTMGETDLTQTFINFIKNPFNTIKNKIKATIEEPFDKSYINSLTKFDKLYINKKASKEIKGSVEGLVFKNLVIEYKNFDTNICSFIDEYNEKTQDSRSGIECSKEGSTYYVLAQGTDFTNLDPGKIWSDLTSKLRIS